MTSLEKFELNAHMKTDELMKQTKDYFEKADVFDAKRITDFLASFNYPIVIFQQVKLDGVPLVPIAFGTDDKIAIAYFVNVEGEEWDVDISSGVENAKWVSQNKVVSLNPNLILKATESLRKLESEGEILPVIILTTGSLKNATAVSEFYATNGITLLKFDDAKAENVRDLGSFAAEQFETQEN